MKTKTFTKFTLIKHKNKTNMTQSTGKYYVYDIPARHDKLIQYINIKTVIQYPMKSKKCRYKFE